MPRTRKPKLDTNHEISFAGSMFLVVVGTLLVVMTVAFIAIPYTLSGNPGSAAPVASSSRHLT